jgi:hypothetical protein
MVSGRIVVLLVSGGTCREEKGEGLAGKEACREETG